MNERMIYEHRQIGWFTVVLDAIQRARNGTMRG